MSRSRWSQQTFPAPSPVDIHRTGRTPDAHARGLLDRLPGRLLRQARDVAALPFDEGFNAYGAERLCAADTVLTGRLSYEMFHGYWPAVAGDPHVSEVEREISRAHNAARKVVISDSLVIDEDEPWSATTTVVPRAEAHATVQEMLAAEG